MTAEQIDTSRSETIPEPAVASANYKPYDGSNLSYAGTFTNPFKANAIRVIEWLTGKITLLRLVRRFERTGRQAGQTFWGKALSLLDIDLLTPDDQIARIPATGPLVVVANHPHGLVDGLILAELLEQRRRDYKILTRSLLTSVPEIQYHMLPVAFPHEPDALRSNLEMRKQAMAHLAEGGAVILFPAGQVATSPGWFDAALEPDWLPFTAKMILKSQARVVPVFFPGQNSRWFQIANHLSLTLRQGLLLHEIASAMHKPQAPVIGEVIDRDAIEPWQGDPRGFMADLRAQTLALGGR
jgi:putative hemolysin